MVLRFHGEIRAVSPTDRVLVLRALRSASLLVVFTAGALDWLGGIVFPPHGNALLYAIAMSWLVAVGIALPATAIVTVRVPLAGWENDGRVYDRGSIRAFRWVLLHSPLGWINPNLQLVGRRTDCDRLLREMHTSEAVHWVTGVLATIVGFAWLVGGYAVYGLVMLLVRIPFDVYPILLHRRNRGRVRRVLSRQLRTSA